MPAAAGDPSWQPASFALSPLRLRVRRRSVRPTNGARAINMYHVGNRELQDHFGTRATADRLAEKVSRNEFSHEDKAVIESAAFFFLATADHTGCPDCSFKGGDPGFVQIIAPDLLVFPDYDGNGMFKSLGNIRSNPNVGLLFILMEAKRRRLRINGRATVHFDDPLMKQFPRAQLMVRVSPEHIFPNCPRYIPDLKTGEPPLRTWSPASALKPYGTSGALASFRARSRHDRFTPMNGHIQR